MKKRRTVLYVVRYPLHENDHLKAKFNGQLKAFSHLGYHTVFIGFDERFFYLIDGDQKNIIGKTHFLLPNYLHTFFYPDLYKAAINVINHNNIDVVYNRKAPTFHKTVSLVKCVKKKGCKFVLEIPTYNPNAKEKDLSWVRSVFRVYSSILEKKIEALPDLYVFMGDGNLETFHGVPAIRIENGVDIESAPLRNPINDHSTIHILTLSSMSYWHGYDRLINSLSEYKGSVKIVIHMVGNDGGGCMNEWKELTKKNHLENQVVFHGPLYGKELDDIFDLCDIGVNSIGKYRKGSNDSSELKTREYISRGLPFVTSVYDVALDGLDTDLWFQITNDDKIPPMHEIVEFALRMKGDPTAKNRLHDHAIRTMTWKSQYQKVFDKLEGAN